VLHDHNYSTELNVLTADHVGVVNSSIGAQDLQTADHVSVVVSSRAAEDMQLADHDRLADSSSSSSGAQDMQTADHAGMAETRSAVQDVQTAVIGPAPDPEIEKLHDNRSRACLTSSRTPAAAWVLTTLFLLHTIQKRSHDNVIGEMSDLVSAASSNKARRNQPYSRRLMIFCLTLAGYSAKAYSFLRSTVKNTIPSMVTLRKYRNKVDGSPGFSVMALKMVKHKVLQLAANSTKLYLSLSCDDMAIRSVYIDYLISLSVLPRPLIHKCTYINT
jgi:hypothetical protein